MLAPGAVQFGRSPIPPGVGDVVAVAVDPRRKGRMAAIGIFSVATFEGNQVDVLDFSGQGLELLELAWGPATSEARSALYILTDEEKVMRKLPDEKHFEVLDLPPVRGMACDQEGRLAFAYLDEEAWRVEVRVDIEPGGSKYMEHSIDAPSFMTDVYLAVAGEALAVAFPYAEPGEHAWMTRNMTREALSEVKMLSGGPLAFQGRDSDAALVGTAIDGNVHGIVRIDAKGIATRIGELEVPKEDEHYSSLKQLAWDESRQTLWVAAGRAGVIASTAPGVTPPWKGTLS
jgi:hypothetical protein